MRRIFFQILLFVLSLPMSAQVKFITEGSVTYERKINVHRQFDLYGDDAGFVKESMSKIPNFHSSQFVLHFKERETVYRPAGDMPEFVMPWMLGPAKENVIYTDLAKSHSSSYKTVFEKTFRIEDSIASRPWRITAEKRTIAGFECRKAVTVICDSVYVVAFFAEEIPVSGGPESFGGLPGMILGIAIPRLHTTWFATGVTLAEPPPKTFVNAAKGQQTTADKLNTTLKSSLKDWGKFGERNMWWIFL